MHNKINRNYPIIKKALLIVHQKRSDPGLIGQKLIDRGYQLDIRRPVNGDKLPDNMDNHDLAVIFGGPMSINDVNQKYIKQDISWIDIVLKSNKPFLGICLGAQMLAKNLGGTVKKNNDNTYEIGFFDIIPTKNGSRIFENQKTFFQWHNEGFNAPKDCCILAEGKKFHQQAFQYKNAFGLQFHPEVSFKLHFLWIYKSLLSAPYKLKNKGAQSIIKQIANRIKHNNNNKLWLDNFLDNYLLIEKV